MSSARSTTECLPKDVEVTHNKHNMAVRLRLGGNNVGRHSSERRPINARDSEAVHDPDR